MKFPGMTIMPDQPLTRRQKLLGDIDPGTARGLEIGALTTPVVRKDEGTILYVDHATREELVAKYAGDLNVDTEQIVPVDAVWGDRTLKECFSGQPCFDYAIASHVVEHVPDMIGWLGEIAEVLRPGGHVILAVPDKRYCFDYLRQPTRLSELVDAWLRRNRRPMPAQLFDYNVNAVEVDMVAAWSGELKSSALRHYVSPRVALDCSTRSARDAVYIDAHCWVFTPRSLLTLLLEMVELDLLPYRCARFYEPERNTNEMVLVLERNGEHPDTEAEKAKARDSFLTQLGRLSFEELAPAEAAGSVRALRTLNRSLETAVASLRPAAESVLALQARVRALEAEVDALRASTSWKLTGPLRMLRMWTHLVGRRRAPHVNSRDGASRAR